jgi:hypothetical protein
MALPVIVALGVVAHREHERIKWWRLDCSLRAYCHEFSERTYSGQPVICHYYGDLPKPDANKAAFHARLKDKWRRAGEHPWLPVEPDPPLPK